MANIKSQIKRIRTNEKRRLRNKAVRSKVRTYVKKFDAAVASGDKEAASEALRVATRELDRAASKGVLHQNSAANKKSSLTKQLDSLSR